MKLAKTYNDYCKEMQILARQQAALRKTVLPQPIDTRNLFALDVDDDIWDDIGLEDDDGIAPPWLMNEEVRKGIRNQLIVDRCVEEEGRLRRETRAMQLWIREEWELLEKACTADGRFVAVPLQILLMPKSCADLNPDVLYQLKLRRKGLARLYLQWRAKVRTLPIDGLDDLRDLPEPDILDATMVDGAASSDSCHSCQTSDTGNKSDGDSGDSVDGLNSDDDLIEELENVAFTDAYHVFSDSSDMDST
jgi:hypothetical protein